MNRIRIGCAITVLIGAIYAAAGLFQSLTHFGAGLAIAAIAVIGYGLCDFLDSERDERLRQYRAEVWHRRDLEAAADTDPVTNIYELPRDGMR